MITSAAAQSETLRFSRLTWLVIGLALGVHIMGFAIITTQIEFRYS